MDHDTEICNGFQKCASHSTYFLKTKKKKNKVLEENRTDVFWKSMCQKLY